jgi:glutaminyl-peptide cyclotransferase
MTAHMRPKSFIIIVAIPIALILGWLSIKWIFLRNEPQTKFDGPRALSYVEKQITFGSRISGSEGHELVLTWLEKSLAKEGWETEIQSGEMMGHPISNLVAKRGEGGPWIVLGAHYDTRMYADRDPDPQKRVLPVPGANDGASGVAVLLELAGVIPKHFPGQIWLVFFDAEDNGEIPGWDWILGSRFFVDNLETYPDAVIIVDMIGDTDQNIFIERNSDLALALQIWGQAAALGYADHFIPIPKFSLIDDHSPFLWAGIPAVDIIDFDYPYWHTVEDTTDKVSAESLQVVGSTLLAWLDGYPENEVP